MKQPKRYLLTSALPYANGALHLGHLAGAYLPADVYARYLRLQGREVLFVCGSDEHGAAITMRAKKEGIAPQAIIDKYHQLNKSTFEKLGISFDYYHRTSSELHHETARDFFTTLYEKGDQFEERTNEQYYDEEYDQFLADRYIQGTCPKCGHAEAFGDQCENCGSALSPTELIEPISLLSGKKPILRETKHWYFRLQDHEDWLREWIEHGQLDGRQHHDPKAWKKHVVGQCLSWLDGGLQARAITRDLDWGIPVPLPDAEGKVLYVWFDAPIGYISATRQWAKENGRNWEDFWKGGDELALVHFIAKDNIVFHCIVFPAMLKAHGGYNLPVNVPANQFLNFEGQKFSKSRGWGLEQHVYLEKFKDFPNKEDALRYALIRNMPENRDSDFKWDEFIEYHDKELADNLGNFLNRVCVLTNKYFDGQVPEPTDPAGGPLPEAKSLLNKLTAEIEAYNFRNAVQLVMELSSLGNTYLQDVSPWKIFKTDPDSPEIKDCLYYSLQIATLLSVAIAPFTPFTAGRIRQLLNLPELQNGDLNTMLEKLQADQALLPVGHKLGQPEILFAKIRNKKDDSLLTIIESEKAQLASIIEEEKEEEPNHSPVKETITFDDFTKLDLRTGTVTAAEKVPKADKLLKLTVDLGFEERTVVSGIAEYYQAEDVVGKRVIVVVNLAPRKLRGIESQGMVLMAENAAGQLTFVGTQADWPNGSPVR